MIAETAVLSTSPWQSDFLTREITKLTNSGDLLNFDFDIPISEFERNESYDGAIQFASEFGSVCSGASVASSICSDETGADGEFDESLFVSESFLNPSSGSVTVETLPQACLWEDNGLEPTAVNPLLDLDDSDDITSTVSPAQQLRTRSLSESSCEHNQLISKPWSEVCSREQIRMIEDLTNIISTQMGLREQLEVIKIINPSASISPTDSEFVIDLNCLSDEKLDLIKDYVSRTVRHVTNSSTSHNNNNNHHNNTCEEGHSSCSSVESSSECSTPQKRLTKKQRRQERREARQRQRKEYRQMLKERKSGLFKKEEVLSVSTSKTIAPIDVDDDDDEDIEVDIL